MTDIAKIKLQCPGSEEVKRPKPEYIPCPKCGSEVEIWSDEVQAKCENCGTLACRERKPSCLDWCKYAKECVGEEKYMRWKKA